MRPAVENVSTEARRDLRVGEQLHEAENATWQWWKEVHRLMKRIATRALIELTPETGRRNQIRVHLADAECTIIGDRKYAARTNPARRLGLHAKKNQRRRRDRGKLSWPPVSGKLDAANSYATHSTRNLPRTV